MFFFTKAKRAQNVNDYESWNEGGVAPTLNAMDNNGEAFATVLIVGVDIYNAEISENAFQTIKAGGGITSMPSVLIIDGTRVNDVRVYEDGIMPTVISRYGTGGGNVPMIFKEEPILNQMQGFGDYKEAEISGTLRVSDGAAQDLVVYPIDDARELEKHQNGTGIGAEGAPAYTLDRQQAPAVVAVDFYNGSTGKTSQTLTANTATHHNIGGVIDRQVVRRLTPVECERLQGFPDNWTDGQADSNRYKQMGNAVAVPVVQWIINRMVEAIKE
jgi:DNA (cytosine-5)-methyltransferase 1